MLLLQGHILQRKMAFYVNLLVGHLIPYSELLLVSWVQFFLPFGGGGQTYIPVMVIKPIHVHVHVHVASCLFCESFCSDNNFDCVTSPLVPVVAHGRLNIAAFILISNLNFERDLIVFFFLLEVGGGGGGFI